MELLDHDISSEELEGDRQEESAETSSSGEQSPADRETELFNRFLAGNDAAFRTLYDAFERPLFLYCRRLLGNDVESQDLFQEVWTRMYRLRGERTSIKRFSGLLFTVARNLCLNALRDSKQQYHVGLDEVPADSDVFVRSVELEESDLREMIQKALQQLPFNQREAFVLREYSGYSYNEIAEITGASMINVKTRAWRARERLRVIIGAWLELKGSE